MRKTAGVEDPLYPMAGNTEEESHNSHLTWYYDTVQLEFEILTLEANMEHKKELWWICKISLSCATNSN